MIDLMCASFVMLLLIAENIYLYAFPKRKYFALRIAAVAAVCITVGLFFPRGRGYDLPIAVISLINFVRYFGLFMLTVGGMMLCYKEKFWNVFAACTAGYATQHFGNRLTSLLNLIPGFNFSFVGDVFVTALIVNPVPYFLAWFFFSRPVAKLKLQQSTDFKMNLLSVSVILMCIVVSRIGDFGGRSVVLNIAISLYGMIVSAMALCVQYALFVQKQKESELRITQYNLEKEKEQYNKWSESINFINTKYHDLKHGLALLEKYGDAAEIAETKAALETYDSHIVTGNEVMDALLEQKSLTFKEKNIQFAYVINGSELAFVSKSDIFSLFGNILDNADYAVTEIGDACNRVINLSVKRIGDMLSIHQENNYQGKIEFSQGLPLSRQRTDPNHGFGVKSISYIVKKYKGTMDISAADNIFSLNIMLPVPQSAPLPAV